MIDLTIDTEQRKRNIAYCAAKGIILPTFAQLRQPETIPTSIKDELKSVGLWEVHPRNLFRITWKNEATTTGGGFGEPNYLVLPPALTGCKATIIGMVGKYFPTGAHKVGATFGCLIPKLITGQFNPTESAAVWPSTGNYCRGGAYVSALMGLNSIAILPEDMSKERFAWLQKVAGEVIATPGCESNVKEIFDKCWELKRTRTDVHIFNQFEEFGNVLWHYEVTSQAMQQALQNEMGSNGRYQGCVLSSGSAGTLGSAYRLKELYPYSKLAVGEALQCPTMLNNGYGGHRIEGIGDKHIPWIHDVKNTDMVIAIDDHYPVRLLRLFNEPAGKERLQEQGVAPQLIDKLSLLGISGIGNLVGAIKFANYYELTPQDFVLTVFTDSLELYGSRLNELTEQAGVYDGRQADRDLELLQTVSIDHVLELDYYQKKRIHNLKYFTWIEQQEKALAELDSQWNQHEEYWKKIATFADKIDEEIVAFNQAVQQT